MNLVASLMVGPGEQARYLLAVIPHLLGFCDAVTVLSEEDDETNFWMRSIGVNVERSEPGTFFAHEGRARQILLDATLEQSPTHVLAIDCDEMVSDGAALRDACRADAGNGAWTLVMDEVWSADERHLWSRQDGGWRSHPVPILYRVPAKPNGLWRIQDRALACGREPMAVRQLASKATATGVSCLPFGWANRAERQARYDRYARADGGKFHASSHLQSILAPDRRVRLQKREWPAALEPLKAELLERANREAVAA